MAPRLLSGLQEETMRRDTFMTRLRPCGGARLALVILTLTGVVACTSTGPAGSTAATSSPPGRSARPASSAPRVSATSSAPAPIPTTVTISRFHAADGAVITLAVFGGPVSYRLHGGSQDPGYPAISGLRGGPRVKGAERRRLLAAFDGGFQLSTGAGGYEQEGRVVRPLLRGMASLVIDQSGAAAIGSWGEQLPRPGELVYSVRQNLTLLVSDGRVAAAAADWAQWGATLGGGEYVARSALGQDAAGRLIYAGSMYASPADLAEALVSAGARTAMELDINPEWVQLDVAVKPGKRLAAAIPGQARPADQYLVGWTRDFITVLGP